MCEESKFNISNSSEIQNFNDSLICPEATSEELATLKLLSFLLDGVVQFIISLLGIFGNAASIFILTRKDLYSFFNQLLVVLVTYDMIYLITTLLESMVKLGFEYDIHTYIFPYLVYPLNAISMMGSIYMTMAVGFERYIAVYHPIEYSIVANDASSHSKRLLKYVAPITLFAIIFNIPKLLEIQVSYEGDKAFMEVTELRISNAYVTWYHNWARFLILGLIPLSVICFLNYKIYIAVNKRRKNARKKQEDNLNLVLMMIIASFVFCNILRILLNLHEITVIDEISLCRCSNLGGFPIWIIILGFITPILLVVNSATNLLIYCVFGTMFRKVLSSYIKCGEEETNQPYSRYRKQISEFLII